jgi:hypothetical protein
MGVGVGGCWGPGRNLALDASCPLTPVSVGDHVSWLLFHFVMIQLLKGSLFK